MAKRNTLMFMLYRSSGFYTYILLVPALFLALLLNGCASIAKGVTQGVIGDPENRPDTRQCYIKGRPFQGLDAIMQRLNASEYDRASDRPILKLLIVHGIGNHMPGYATRLAENIARSLQLNRVQERTKQIVLAHPLYPQRELGLIRFNRYLSHNGNREMLLAELTWDPIIENEKQSIAFDNSGEYAFRRATANNALKEFINATLPDVLMYNGTSRTPILLSIGQSLCWLMNETWETLPASGQHSCMDNSPRSLSRLHDHYVFITHSLGSRVTVDALQWIATKVGELAKDHPEFEKKRSELQAKDFTVVMLSNQLPLLQLGQTAPAVTGRIAEICSTSAPSERLFKETRLIAFSDPNDLFSYAIPQRFIDQKIDSRLCPTLTNVILNIAPVNSLLGNEFVNPLAAHTDYDNDERVIGIISGGIGSEMIRPIVKERCRWLETVPDQQQ
jgi:hypothetical protein